MPGTGRWSQRAGSCCRNELPDSKRKDWKIVSAPCREFQLTPDCNIWTSKVALACSSFREFDLSGHCRASNPKNNFPLWLSSHLLQTLSSACTWQRNQQIGSTPPLLSQTHKAAAALGLLTTSTMKSAWIVHNGTFDLFGRHESRIILCFIAQSHHIEDLGIEAYKFRRAVTTEIHRTTSSRPSLHHLRTEAVFAQSDHPPAIGDTKAKSRLCALNWLVLGIWNGGGVRACASGWSSPERCLWGWFVGACLGTRGLPTYPNEQERTQSDLDMSDRSCLSRSGKTGCRSLRSSPRQLG